MAKTQVLEYTIYLRDATRVAELTAQLQAGTGPGELLRIGTGNYRIHRAPYGAGPPPGGAAVEFGSGLTLPLVNVGAVIPDETAAPNGYITSPWFTTSNSYRTDVASFRISSGWWIFGHDTLFHWAGSVALAPVASNTGWIDPVALTPAPIPKRYWIDGGEYPGGEGGNYGETGNATFDAGMDPGSLGIALRSSAATVRSHRFSDLIASGTGRPQSWERLYIRCRVYPEASIEFWRSHYSSEFFAGTSANLFISMAPGGQLIVSRLNSTGGTGVLFASGAGVIPLNTKVRLDILHRYYDTTAAQGGIEVYVNGSLIGSGTGQLHFATLPNGRHGQSTIGGPGAAANIMELDVDGWICSDVPLNHTGMFSLWTSAGTYWIGDLVRYTAGATTVTYKSLVNANLANQPNISPAQWAPLADYTADPIDFVRGSLIQSIRPTGFGGTNAWVATAGTADGPSLAMRGANATVEGMSNAVSGAQLVVTTDVANQVAVPGAQGYAALQVTSHSMRGATAANASLGYKLNGAAAVLAAITESNGALAYQSVFLAASDNAALVLPAVPTSLELVYQKGASVDTARVKTLAAVIELIGIFSDCDKPTQDQLDAYTTINGDEAQLVSAIVVPPPSKGAHMAPYPFTPWSRVGAPPLSPVVIKAGTYTGNGTGQDLTFSAPVNMLWIRPLTGDTGGLKWWSSQTAPHIGLAEGYGSMLLGPLKQDLTFTPASSTADQQMQFVVRLAGAHAQINSNGVSYQYIAWSDPGARFSLAGATLLRTASSPSTRSLQDTAFTPEFLFVVGEDAGTGTTTRMYSKGAGNAVDSISKLDVGTEIATALTINTGSLTWRSGIITPSTLDSLSFIGFRRADGNNDPNQAALMSVGTYTGDGNASRTINAGTAGKRPLFAFVQPLNGNAGIVRDASHTTTTSQTVAGSANASTGITAGAPDAITVGSALNTNTVVYNYFILWGSTTAGNGGWSVNGEFAPVASDSPIDASYLTEPEVIEEATDDGGGEVDTTDPGLLDTDIAADCVASSTRLVNIALSRLGVTKALTSLATDNTAEGSAARMVYKTEVDAVLRDFPWPFATRYATLVLVGGTSDTAVNGDWQYSYRAPADSVFVRRIVNDSNKRNDTDPIAFRMGQDDLGDLVFTDEPGNKLEADADVDVEYTRRVDCPARVGDSIFRSAAAWRLARALCMPLARDEKMAVMCEQQYQRELLRARAVHSREKEAQHLESDNDAEWIRGRE